MDLSDLIAPRSIVAQLRVTTKKQALQELAKRAASLSGLPERQSQAECRRPTHQSFHKVP